MAVFAAQRAKGKEPSTPRKIAIGMGIAATGFLIMAIGSYVSNLPMHKYNRFGYLSGEGDSAVADGYLSDIDCCRIVHFSVGHFIRVQGGSPKYQGIMQGGWLGATAIGNQLLVIGAILYESIPIWMTWTVFVVACCISMFTMLFMLKWLEKVAK